MSLYQIGFVLVIVTACCLAYPVSTCSQACGEDSCKNSTVDCVDGFLKPNATLCGCCPVCVHYLGRGDECRAMHIPPDYECGEDLQCNEKTGTCVPPDSGAVTGAEPPLMSCHLAPPSLVSCSIDGTYAPRQCDAEWCFCVTPEGTKIEPYQLPRKEGSGMECVCARVETAVAMVTKQKVEMCDKFGNYKQRGILPK